MPARRKKASEPPHPPQDPFITDEDMPAGWLDAARRSATAAGGPVRYVYVVSTSEGPGERSPIGAFRTPAAADATARRQPDKAQAQVEAIRLYTSVDDWSNG